MDKFPRVSPLLQSDEPPAGKKGWWITIYCYPPTDNGDEPGMDKSYNPFPKYAPNKLKWYGYKVAFFTTKTLVSSSDASSRVYVQRDDHNYDKDLNYVNSAEDSNDGSGGSMTWAELSSGKAGDLKVYFLSMQYNSQWKNDRRWADFTIRHASLT